MIQEMTAQEADALLRELFVGRVGCHTDGLTYVVPVIYAWDGECAYVYSVEGQKVRMMRANPTVCFEVDEYRAGGSWRSAIVQGTYEELQGEKAALTLKLLSDRFARPASAGAASGQERPARGEGRTPVAFRIRATSVTGRKVNRSAPAAAKRGVGRFLVRRAARNVSGLSSQR